MRLASEGHRWHDLPPEDHNFLYEMIGLAIVSLIIVVLFG